MIWLVLIVMGAIFGSFVNALVWRLYLRQTQLPKSIKQKPPQELSITRGRSMCSSCGHPLSIKDLIPIISWLWLKGRCRYCKKPIDDTPLPEILLPLLFVLSYWLWPYALANMTDTLVLFVWLTLLVVLVALFVYDLRWMVLPNKLVAVFSALALVKILLLSFETGAAALVLASAGAVTLGGIFYLLHAISDGKWIGGGDVKLGFGLGLLAGNPVGALLLLFIASLLGSLISLPQLISRNLSLSSRLPFGPLLIIAAFVVVLIGQDIINVYQDIFLIHHE